MFAKSIRWRLQLWIAFLLVCVLSGFGITVYQLQRLHLGDCALAGCSLSGYASAVEFNRPGGEIRVLVDAQQSSALLRVADTGEGIPAEDVPHIFERFYRVDKARSSHRGGTGLGLAICKAIVDAHGGSIEVSSQPGAGSTFTVRLPLP